MQRNKTVAYDADDLYPSDDDDDDYGGEEAEYTEEDRANFAALTPVVRAEVEEEGLKASQREIEDALWECYWDVEGAVGMIRGWKRGKGDGGAGASAGKNVKEKAGSRFDAAAERGKSAAVAGGEFESFSCFLGWGFVFG